MKKTLLTTVTALLILTGCSDDKKDETKQVSQQQEQKVEVKQEIKEEVKAKTTNNNVEDTKDSSKVQEKSQENSSTKVEEPKVEAIKESEEVKVVDAEALFKSCVSCHGQKGEKEALGKSQIIAGWDKNRVINALNGYKDGTYGGAMKGVMKPHVDKKTAEEIEALATFISNL